MHSFVFLGGGKMPPTLHRLVAQSVWLLKNQQIEVTSKDAPSVTNLQEENGKNGNEMISKGWELEVTLLSCCSIPANDGNGKCYLFHSI